MAKYKITQDHDACISCQACVNVCPENWKMGADGKAAPIKKALDDIGNNQKAADACPVTCIKIEKVK
ncbi:ferredoxin [Candidatus Woesearchaeota archaeon]|nr:ferredoxin [Candidatus Woesearchaeota archaeon]